jgi:uncharacterized membrane protein YphA (DoxX/SURF4 family)
VSLGIVFLRFGLGKLQHDYWARTIMMMDIFKLLPWDVSVTVQIIGLVEVITGIALISGFFTRLFAGIAGLMLMGILVLLNFSEIRDIALFTQALFLVMTKDEAYGICSLFKKTKK